MLVVCSHSIFTASEAPQDQAKPTSGFSSNASFPVHEFAGEHASCIPMIPWAHWRLRTFQLGFLEQWKRGRLSLPIRISAQMQESLWWWIRQGTLTQH